MPGRDFLGAVQYARMPTARVPDIGTARRSLGLRDAAPRRSHHFSKWPESDMLVHRKSPPSRLRLGPAAVQPLESRL